MSRAKRPAVEVRIRFGWRDFSNAALDANLPLELLPQEHDAHPCIAGDFLALAAQIVGEKDEAARVAALEQNDARGRTAALPDSRERHRSRLGQLGLDRLTHP